MQYEFTLSIYSAAGPVSPVSTHDRRQLLGLLVAHFGPAANDDPDALAYEIARLHALLRHTDEQLAILCGHPDITGLALSNHPGGLQLHVNPMESDA